MMSRLPIVKISIYALLTLIAFIVADLALLLVRGGLFPTQPPPAQPPMRLAQGMQSGNLSAITSRNIFNSDGKIAAAKSGTSTETEKACPPPKASDIPVTLLGTIVHANPARSIASISTKAKPDPIAIKVGGTIPDNVAQVTKIERSKISFHKMNSTCEEFIELKDDAKVNFGAAAYKPVQQGEVLKKSDTDFELKRDDINKLTSNLPELLQQARAVPRMGPGGMIECFSLAEISQGSIYERLGLKRGDCIKSVNGEKIDSPAKAMELYNALRSSANSINLGVERGGRDDNFQYNITQ
jgi:general secretion pathway protein C